MLPDPCSGPIIFMNRPTPFSLSCQHSFLCHVPTLCLWPITNVPLIPPPIPPPLQLKTCLSCMFSMFWWNVTDWDINWFSLPADVPRVCFYIIFLAADVCFLMIKNEYLLDNITVCESLLCTNFTSIITTVITPQKLQPHWLFSALRHSLKKGCESYL